MCISRETEFAECGGWGRVTVVLFSPNRTEEPPGSFALPWISSVLPSSCIRMVGYREGFPGTTLSRISTAPVSGSSNFLRMVTVIWFLLTTGGNGNVEERPRVRVSLTEASRIFCPIISCAVVGGAGRRLEGTWNVTSGVSAIQSPELSITG